jgi:hypothetical protein
LSIDGIHLRRTTIYTEGESYAFFQNVGSHLLSNFRRKKYFPTLQTIGVAWYEVPSPPLFTFRPV